MRMRITYIIPSMRVGGTERQLLYLMEGLAAENEVNLVCTSAGGAWIGEARRIAARVQVLKARSGWDFTQQWAIADALRAHPPHVMHTFLFGFDLYANKAAQRAGVPVIVSSRRELAHWQKRRHLFMQRRANRYVQAIVANSEAVADDVRRREQADPSLVRVIPNGLHADACQCHASNDALRERFGLPKGKHIVGMVANFSPVKDHRLFLDMAGILLQRRQDVHFVLVGTGPLLDAIGCLVLRRGQAEHFNRFATINEIAELQAVMDVSVLCSKREGFPNAIMESMAAGKPVVAAAVGGVTELVREGETGRLVHSREPKDFADAVETCLNHPEEARRMGGAAARWVREHLTVEQMVDRHRALYHELLERHAKRKR